MLSHDNLQNIYRVNFDMIQHHKYSLTELENMMPWEKQIYVSMLINHIEEENERIKQENAKMRS
jgi:hypothetical protein